MRIRIKAFMSREANMCILGAHWPKGRIPSLSHSQLWCTEGLTYFYQVVSFFVRNRRSELFLQHILFSLEACMNEIKHVS